MFGTESSGSPTLRDFSMWFTNHSKLLSLVFETLNAKAPRENPPDDVILPCHIKYGGTEESRGWKLVYQEISSTAIRPGIGQKSVNATAAASGTEAVSHHLVNRWFEIKRNCKSKILFLL